MPTLTGTEISSAIKPDEERAVDHRAGAEVAVRRIPVVGEDSEAFLLEPRPRVVEGGVDDQREDDQHEQPARKRQVLEQSVSDDPRGSVTGAQAARWRGAGWWVAAEH